MLCQECYNRNAKKDSEYCSFCEKKLGYTKQVGPMRHQTNNARRKWDKDFQQEM